MDKETFEKIHKTMSIETFLLSIPKGSAMLIFGDCEKNASIYTVENLRAKITELINYSYENNVGLFCQYIDKGLTVQFFTHDKMTLFFELTRKVSNLFSESDYYLTNITFNNYGK